MLLDRLRFKPDFDLGVYNNTKLDTVNVNQYQHPAVTAALSLNAPVSATGPQIFAGATGITLSGGNLWTNLVSTGGPASPQIGIIWTRQSGDYIQIVTTTQVEVTIQLMGFVPADFPFASDDVNLVADAVRNGAIANITVDGVTPAGGHIDTYNGTPLVTLFLDGAAHTIRITHTGTFNGAVQPIGPVVAASGTTMSSNLSLSVSTTQKTFQSASWQVTATASGGTGVGTYTLFRTLPGAGQTTIATGLVVGTTYDLSTRVPGVSMVVNGTITNTDSATFLTDQVMVGVSLINTYTGSGGAGGSYSTPIIDSGFNETQWFASEWLQGTLGNVPFPSVSILVGNSIGGGGGGGGIVHVNAQSNSIQNGTTTTVTPPSVAILPQSGLVKGLANWNQAPVGRYAQVTITFPSITTVLPYFRDLFTYCWIPTAAGDPQVLGKLPLPANSRPGPNLLRLLGAYAMHVADCYAAVQDLMASYSVTTAVDQYLLAHGLAFGLVPYSGEPQAGFRSRVAAFYKGRAQAGGSLPFIAGQVAQLVYGSPQTVVQSTVAGKTQCVANGVTVVQTSSQGFTVTVPRPPYPGLAELAVAIAQAEITDYVQHTLTPVNSVVTITYLS